MVMKGVATVRAVSLLAVVAIVLGLWISYGFVQDSDAVNQDEMESSFATVENDAPPSDQGMDLEDDNKENHDGSNRELSNGLIISGLGTFGSILLGSVLLEFVRVIVLMALLTPLLSRLKGTREDLLTRGRIMGYLEANAGIHFSALRDALGLANGVTAYHLQVLEAREDVYSWRDGKLRRYAPSGISKSELGRIKSPIIGTRLAILEVLADSGTLGVSGSEIRKKTMISRQLLSHHLAELRKSDIIEPASERKRPNWKLSSKGLQSLETSRKLSIIESSA
jgi:DNA-binding transcriptional ArsR family regulator|tara:strand:+ start:88 stop:930 length:843 start_codon:yes stop_codon:yes gene_type:complete